MTQDRVNFTPIPHQFSIRLHWGLEDFFCQPSIA